MREDRGAALIVSMLALVLLSAAGAALVLTSSAETLTAANFQAATEALYAADAAAERAADDVSRVADWDAILSGTLLSTFVDGAPGGERTLADGTILDLSQAVNQANCRRTAPCSPGDMDAITAERPWGINNPRWQLYAFGPAARLTPSAPDSPYYIVVLAGDDGHENDGDPLVDGGAALPPATDNPGRGVLVLRAIAFGSAGSVSTVELTIERTARTVSWREVW